MKNYLVLLFSFLMLSATAQKKISGLATLPTSEEKTELEKNLSNYELTSIEFSQVTESLKVADEIEFINIKTAKQDWKIVLKEAELLKPRAIEQIKTLGIKDFKFFKGSLYNEPENVVNLMVAESIFYAVIKDGNELYEISPIIRFAKNSANTNSYVVSKLRDLSRTENSASCADGLDLVQESDTDDPIVALGGGGSFSCSEFSLNFSTQTTSQNRVIEFAFEVDPSFVTATGGGFGTFFGIIIPFVTSGAFYSGPDFNLAFVITNITYYTTATNPYTTVASSTGAGQAAVNASITANMAGNTAFTRDIVVLYTGIQHTLCGRVGAINSFCTVADANFWIRSNCLAGVTYPHELGHLFGGTHPGGAAAPFCSSTFTCDGSMGPPPLMCPGDASCVGQLVTFAGDNTNNLANIQTKLSASTACYTTPTSTITGNTAICGKTQSYSVSFTPGSLLTPNITWTVGPGLAIQGSNTGSSIIITSNTSQSILSFVQANISYGGAANYLTSKKNVYINPVPQIRVSGNEVQAQCSNNSTFAFNVLCPPDNLKIEAFIPGIPNATFTFQCFGPTFPQVSCTPQGSNTLNVFIPSGVTGMGLTVTSNTEECGQNGRTFVLLPNYTYCYDGGGYYFIDAEEANLFLDNLEREGLKNQVSSLDWENLKNQIIPSNLEMKLYPNPISKNDDLIVELPRTKESYEVKIIDLHGKVLRILNSDQSKMELSIENLNPGIYFIQASSEKFIDSKKIIVTN